MNILGLSAFYHDSAACLVRDGHIVAASQEERFTRVKHDPAFPAHAVGDCLRQGGITIGQVDHVVFYEKPFLKFERLLATHLAHAPHGFRTFRQSMPLWLKKKLWMRSLLHEQLDYPRDILFVEHHESHAASAFFPSPFEEAAVLTVDGVGEWATSSFGVGRGHSLSLLGEIDFPHSLGLLYSAFTSYLGFKVNSGEYKVMGLAPYGRPRYAEIIRRELIKISSDGSFRLDLSYFDYCVGSTMTNARFHDLFGGPPRAPEGALDARHMDLAASIQAVTEQVMVLMARHAKKETGADNLCLAGGVALNCVANGLISREKIFKDIWVQPAAGDAGGALGAALLVWHHYLGGPRETRASGRDGQQGSLLGPAFDNDVIAEFLLRGNIPHRRLSPTELPQAVADVLSRGAVVGWFSGRMEYGPRALGARSILGDPRVADMQSKMNLKIKFRESFRPFAPAVLNERVSDYFELETQSPYMLLVAPVRPSRRRKPSPEDDFLFGIERLNQIRSDIPAVTHVDYSARVQTVRREDNPAFYDLLKAFENLTGCGVLVNTSFNVRGEPIVLSPEDAFACFMRTDMDYLALGDFLLSKNEQPKLVEDKEWMTRFALD